MAIVIAVALSLAVVPAAAETFGEHMNRLAEEQFELQVLAIKQQREGGLGDLTFLENISRENNTETKLCESYRHGMRTLNEVLNNGPLARVQTAIVKLDRNMLAQALYAYFPLPWLGLVSPADGLDPRTLQALSPAEWQDKTVDVGWGEGCMAELFEGLLLGCDGSGMYFLSMFDRWDGVLNGLGLYEESFQVGAAFDSGKHAYLELCGISQDE